MVLDKKQEIKEKLILMGIVINKQFHGGNKYVCLQYNKKRKECYLHFNVKPWGPENNKKLKVGHNDIGRLLTVLDGQKQMNNFFHEEY